MYNDYANMLHQYCTVTIMEGEQGRMTSLNSSVYVRGFPSGSASEEALVKIFSQFGPVKKVYIDSTKVCVHVCCVCMYICVSVCCVMSEFTYSRVCMLLWSSWMKIVLLQH